MGRLLRDGLMSLGTRRKRSGQKIMNRQAFNWKVERTVVRVGPRRSGNMASAAISGNRSESRIPPPFPMHVVASSFWEKLCGNCPLWNMQRRTTLAYC